MAADTYTSTLGAILMGTGNDNNAWGSNLNTLAIQILEDAIANVLQSSVTGGTLDLSTNPPPNAASLARYYALIFSGALTSNQIIKVPNLSKSWWVRNGTTGAFSLTIETPGGSGAAIPQNGGWQFVQCDGAGNIIVSPFNSLQIQMPDGSAAAPVYSDINETNSGWYRNNTQDWRLAIDGEDVLQVTGVGAGTASVVNVISPNVLQVAGVQYIPAGTEVAFAGITVPTGWYLEYGQAVERATDPNLLNALRATFTGDVTNGSNTITGVSANLTGLGLEGAALEGTGLSGLTISSITSTTITMSGNATAGSGGSQTCHAYPYGNGDGATTFNVPDRRGRAVAGRDNMGGTAASRLTTGGSGIAGNELGAAGGAETVTLMQAQLPAVAPTGTVAITDPGHTHTNTVSGGPYLQATGGSIAPGGGVSGASEPTVTIHSNTTGITASFTGNNLGSGSATDVTQPTGISNFIIKR
ncbi:MAG: hypothetical protein ACLPKB_24705 [Xanthobacteraceae bacterium]